MRIRAGECPVSHLARLSLANRAVIALTTVAVFLLGVFSMTTLKQELIPSLQIPQAAVITTYPGAAPDVVADQVSRPIEGMVLTVEGVENVSSVSSTNVSVVSVEMTYGTDMDAATTALRGAVARLDGTLPDAADSQIITGSVDDLPVLYLAVSGVDDSVSQADLADTVNNVLVPALDD